MLLVLRHAESEWNLPPKRCQGQLDAPLSEAGRAAARELGQHLALPDAAYSSHLSRARETAALLLESASRRHGREPPEIREDRRLAEAFCGEWEGLPLDEVRRRWPAEWEELGREDRAFAFPGGEALSEVLARFATALEEVGAHHRGQSVLVVAHGGPMRLFLAAGRGGGPLAPGGPPGNLEGFVVDDAGGTTPYGAMPTSAAGMASKV